MDFSPKQMHGQLSEPMFPEGLHGTFEGHNSHLNKCHMQGTKNK